MYIGQQPVVGRYILLDQISGGFNGTTSGFTMSTAGGVQGVKPGLAQNVLLSLGGVIQQPGVDYTISGSGITFTTPPVSGTTFFATVLGDAQSVGTPSDGTVTPASIAAGYDFAFPNVNVTGVTTIASGSASTPSLSVTGDSNTGLLSPAANTLAVSTDGTERLRVDSSGNVGIGTSSITEKLTVFSNNDTSAVDNGLAVYRSAGDDKVNINCQGGAARFISDGGSSYIPTRFGRYNGTTLVNDVTIDTAGNFGIGVTSPGYLLEIRSSSSDGNFVVGNSSGQALQGGYSTGGVASYIQAYNTASSAFIDLNVNGSTVKFGTGSGATERMRIDSSGRLLLGTSSAITTYRLEVVQDSGSNLALVCGSSVSAANGPYQIFTRSRGSTSSPSVVQDGDTTGVIEFRGYSGAASAYRTNAAISSAIDGTPDSGGDTTDMPGRLVFSTTADGNNSPTERMRINRSGNVGLGTTSPNHRLTLHNSGTGTFDALNITSGLTNSNGLQLGIDSSSNVFFWHTANGAIKFATNNVERVRVTNNGLTFNGDSAAANALNDYEEGSFTPTYPQGITSPTYSGTGGHYTKIGNLVTVTIRIRATGTNAGSRLQIGGLPFTSSGSDEGSFNFGYADNISGSSGSPLMHLPENSSTIQFYNQDGSDWDGNSGNGVSARTLHLRGFYYTNS